MHASKLAWYLLEFRVTASILANCRHRDSATVVRPFIWPLQSEFLNQVVSKNPVNILNTITSVRYEHLRSNLGCPRRRLQYQERPMNDETKDTTRCTTDTSVVSKVLNPKQRTTDETSRLFRNSASEYVIKNTISSLCETLAPFAVNGLEAI